MLTIIGLGNPLPEYSKTRHNIGEHIISALVKSEGIDLSPKKLFMAEMGKGKIGTKSVMFVLPQTYMNDSGKTVKKLVPDSTAKIEHKDILVIHDDLDLPLGVTKMVYESNSAGHKGVDSINKALKSTKYYRLKIGVTPVDAEGNTRKPSADKMQNFITGAFTDGEWTVLKKTTKKAIEILQVFVLEGAVKATEMANKKV